MKKEAKTWPPRLTWERIDQLKQQEKKEKLLKKIKQSKKFV
jgi:hypothetical protein